MVTRGFCPPKQDQSTVNKAALRGLPQGKCNFILYYYIEPVEPCQTETSLHGSSMQAGSRQPCPKAAHMLPSVRKGTIKFWDFLFIGCHFFVYNIMHGVMYSRCKYVSVFAPINTTTFVESKFLLKFDFVSNGPFSHNIIMILLLHNFSIIANEVNR